MSGGAEIFKLRQAPVFGLPRDIRFIFRLALQVTEEMIEIGGLVLCGLHAAAHFIKFCFAALGHGFSGC